MTAEYIVPTLDPLQRQSLILKGLLAQSEYSQRKLAMLMDIDPAYINRCFNGEYSMATDRIIQMCDILGVSKSEALIKCERLVFDENTQPHVIAFICSSIDRGEFIIR